jgi:hypothetical protein
MLSSAQYGSEELIALFEQADEFRSQLLNSISRDKSNNLYQV